MLSLGATVVALAFLAGVVDPQSVPENLPVAQLPVDAANTLPVDAVNAPLPLPLPLPLSLPIAKPSGPRQQPAKGSPAGGAGGKCPTVASYRLSADKLQEYLNGSLPVKIEELVKCSDVNLAGLVGSLLNTVCGTDLLSLLPLDAVSGLTDILPLNMLGGVLGKGGEAKAPSPAEGSDAATVPVPPVVPDGLPVPVPGAEPALAAAAEPVSQIANDVVAKAKSVPGAAGSLLKGLDLGKVGPVGDLLKVVPTGVVGDTLSSVTSIGSGTGGLDVSGLLLNAKVGEVTVNSVTYTMTDGGVEARASVTVDVTADGAAGVAITLLGFQVDMDVTVLITSAHDPANNTCQLEVEQKAMDVNKVSITLVKTVLDTLPLPLPLPLSLDDVVLMALSVELTENAKESSCAIQLDDFNTGRNVTGALCQYTIANTKISADGLCISYCAKCTWNKVPVSMPGSLIPKHPKNDSVSLILSHKTVKEFVARCAKPVRVKVGDVEARINKLSYGYRPTEKLELIMEFGLKKAGQPYGIAQVVAMYSHLCRTANGKMVADIKMIRVLQQNTIPPEIMDEMPGLVTELLSKAVSAVSGCLSQWNLPTGVSSYPAPSAKLVPLKTNDLQSGK